jgi:hypothetical protein
VDGIAGKHHRNWIVWIFASILSLALAACTGSVEPLVDGVMSEAATSVGANDQGDGLEGNSGEESGGTASNAPTVGLTASDLTVPEGGSVTLSWHAPGADSCSASGGWSGQLDTSGNRLVGPMQAGTTFSLNCSGPGGTSLEMISVAVVGPVELSWVPHEQNVDGSELVDLAGYRLYFGESSRDYSDSVELSDTTATSHTLELATGSYYIAMTAFDTEGHESNYSNEVQRYRP